MNAECLGVYERVHRECPYCGHVSVPQGRSAPEQVDGDLYELDAAVLARLRGEISRIEGAPQYPANSGPEVKGAINKNHWARQQAHERVKHVIAVWSGWQRALGRSDSESYRRFFFKYGVDVATAQTLNSNDSTVLADRIESDLNSNNVKGAT